MIRSITFRSLCSLTILGVLVGGAVTPDLDRMYCEGAAGPRPVSGVSSPGTTVSMSVVENVTDCGVATDSRGVWWKVVGTGEIIRASTCDSRTTIKTKISVFSGSCDALECVVGTSRPDYECDVLSRGENGEWGTLATSVDFQSVEGQMYYFLVQDTGTEGEAWLKFTHPTFPQNNDCIDSIGPIPRDLTRIEATSVDAAISDIDAGYCGASSYYPGIWYQFFGTGGEVSIMACGQYNEDGFSMSVYNGAHCDAMTCVTGTTETDIEDADKCTFGAAKVLRPLTKHTVQTNDRDRYFVYVRYELTDVDKPTSDFYLWIDDGAGGTAGTGGVAAIKFADPAENTDDDDSNSDKSAATRGSVLSTLTLAVVGYMAAVW
eukprot:Nitzschia sp. Nitz4//scaffold99_size76975//65797//67091//NITZ4_005584-RA/size76975-snap-gene-0.8-mRNA-1//-1//CDS//3329560874//2445//frame0